ncbi:MAG: hypothetical protein ACU85V_00205 [Gammaproteobacteria bacterium]
MDTRPTEEEVRLYRERWTLGVREYRYRTGAGLKEAKYVLDAAAAGREETQGPTELDKAHARIAELEAERDAALSFAHTIMESWPCEDGVDGFDLQDAAVAAGLLVPARETIPCCDTCICEYYYETGEKADCYRWSQTMLDYHARAALRESSDE